MSDRPSFFAELQRRHVYKVGAAYCVAGWLLVQIVTQVFPIFDVSALVQRIIVLVIVAGFPLALVLAWLFDITPEGIVRTPDLPAADETAATMQQRRTMDRKLNYVLGGLLLIGAVYVAVEHSGSRGAVGVTPSRPTDSPVDKSIAVLPFENLSDDKANGYFAEGIQDEILTRLARIGALKVISRTSTAHYASAPDNLPEIARQLGVANILEGSVQKAGDAVHINVQLIRAVTDEHLWAESYNRKLDDIFGVEGEVAQTVAEALNAKLSGREKQAIAAQGTTNPAAYEAYLRGRALSTDSRKHAEDGIAALHEAVRLDPGYALAWADLSIMQTFLYINGFDADTATAASIKQALDEALRLQPDAPEVRFAQGYYRYRVQHDLPAAREDFEAVLQQTPGDASVIAALAFVERRLGLWPQALHHLQQAFELNPRDAGVATTIGGELYLNVQRWDDAHLWLQRALAIEPGDALAEEYLTNSYQYQGRLDESARLLDAIPVAGQDPLIAIPRAYQRLLEHRYDAAISEIGAAVAVPPKSLDGALPQLLVYLGTAQQRAGHEQEAKASFERAIREIGPSGAGQVDDNVLPLLLALAEAGNGLLPAAMEQAHRGVDLFKSDALHAAQAYETLAQVQAANGDTEAAFATLMKVQQMPTRSTVALLRLDPLFDPLRRDPRFNQVIAAGEAAAKTDFLH